MDRKDRTMFRELPRFQLIIACASLGVFPPVETAESALRYLRHSSPTEFGLFRDEQFRAPGAAGIGLCV